MLIGSKGGDNMAKRSQHNTIAEQGAGRRPWNEITIEPEELEGYCVAYFEKCQAAERCPTKPGLAVYLGISVDTYDRWAKNEDGRHGKHAAVLKKAEAIMSDLLQQRKDTMALFLLKQPCYGGYTDKQADDGNQVLRIKVSFGGKSG